METRRQRPRNEVTNYIRSTTAMSEQEDVASVDGSDTSGTSRNSKPKIQEEETAIASEETKQVGRLKVVVILVLIASTVAVAVAVYKYVSGAERQTFEASFEDDSDKVLEAMGSALDHTLGSVDAFLVTVASYARDSNSTWPMVTLPDYAVRLAKLRSLSNAVLVSQYHFVTGEQREAWENYTVANDGWVQEGIDVQAQDETFHGKIVTDYWTRGDIHDTGEPYFAPGPYFPKWQQAPVIPIYAPYNWDAMTFPPLNKALHIVQGDRQIAISDVSNIPYPNDPVSERQTHGNNHFIKDYVGEGEDETEPFSDIYFPMLDYASDFVTIPTDNETSGQHSYGNFVGVFAMTFYWRDLIKDILPPQSNGIVVAFENSCGQTFTYQVNGAETVYLGRGDLHEHEYDHLEKESPLTKLDAFSIRDRAYTGLPVSEKGCQYTLHVYPSKYMEQEFTSNDPIIFTIAAVAIFAFTSLVFIVYDSMVERRQQKVMKSAVQSNAIVSSLFPKTVRDRLFPTEQDNEPQKRKVESTKVRLKTFLSDGKGLLESTNSVDDSLEKGAAPAGSSSSNPIADLFPNCTVLFSDIAGFTAWSSVREPVQVFTLLEALYGAFDSIALKRGVFKVETIGDAYVAVVGLPEPREDHAVVMAKFARDCNIQMVGLVRDLETTLGPGTGELRLRFGLHSGPVTAGVLRGQKSRFQLFGDTVNTASRMESTGLPNRIQVSSTTAELLIQAGKNHWVKPRDELVHAKGKGTVQTYWVEPTLAGNTTGTITDSSGGNSSEEQLDDKTKRLVDWNVDILSRLLKRIQARRQVSGAHTKKTKKAEQTFGHPSGSVLDEVKEVIELPDCDPAADAQQEHAESIDLDKDVEKQLRDYVVMICIMYNSNPFHNFAHASHVGMSTAKLFGRILAADDEMSSNLSPNEARLAKHDHTCGLSSDPLAHFVCIFSALVHDVDHPGVPNFQLIQEKSQLADQYKGRSIAEQNSVEIAWGLLMRDEYSSLRSAICETPKELQRFREMLINIVIATDIFDKGLKEQRSMRWEKAFANSNNNGESDSQIANRRATIILEHLIQASDVAHTMQHWHVFCKWNQRLFDEMYSAYLSGRSNKNPAEFWYSSEIAFFDNYIIPLAKKLRDCGVFGVSSDEYLTYAMKNREEWKERGEAIVEEFVEAYNEPSESFEA